MAILGCRLSRAALVPVLYQSGGEAGSARRARRWRAVSQGSWEALNRQVGGGLCYPLPVVAYSERSGDRDRVEPHAPARKCAAIRAATGGGENAGRKRCATSFTVAGKASAAGCSCRYRYLGGGPPSLDGSAICLVARGASAAERIHPDPLIAGAVAPGKVPPAPRNPLLYWRRFS